MDEKEAKVYAAVVFVTEQRKKAKRAPLTVLRSEIYQSVDQSSGRMWVHEIDAALESLVQKGKIKKSQAIHEDCYIVNEK